MCDRDCFNCELPLKKCHGGGNCKKTANIIPNRAIVSTKRVDGVGKVKTVSGCKNKGKYI